MTARNVALVAGFLFLALAAFVQGILPMLEPQARTTGVTRVVRTELGDLKWFQSHATDYTPEEAHGRKVYIREGCWYCHSQYVRPVTGETRRWGPVSQAGEYAYDLPHLFSTRRIGPDLTRVGLKYSDEWHYAHFWDPRMIVPDSIMPRFSALFAAPSEPVRVVKDSAGLRTIERTPLTELFFDFAKAGDRLAHLPLTPNREGLLFVPARGRYPVIHTPNDEFKGDTVRLVVVTNEVRALVAYLQKLGMNRGNWRDVFEPQVADVSRVTMPRSQEWIEHGKDVYERRCAGCHGVKGDGNGPAATFMHKNRPRDFTKGVFKFRETPSNSLPTDGDLLRTITRGVRGTAMPSWHMLPEKDRLAVVQYVKHELAVDRSDPAKPFAYFAEDRPKPPVEIGDPPAPSRDLVARGNDVWRRAKCWECHGHAGKGDGEKGPGLKGDDGFPVPPADLTTGEFKSGPTVRDIFRTVSTGLSGTPMPSYAGSLSAEDRWALAYYVLSLSSFKDPLTGKPLPITPQDRAVLNDPATKAETSRQAYVPRHGTSASGPAPGENPWARRRGIEPATTDESAAKTSKAGG